MSRNKKNKKWFTMMAAVIVCFAFSPPQAGALERQKLIASDGAASDIFGQSVSISGDYAIVGAYQDDDKGADSGSAYIFKRDGNSWSQQAKLTASDGAALDGFGNSVSISGDYAIVGALYDDDKGTNSGSAYIFKRDGSSWNQQQKLLASDGAFGDSFGCSVSISSDYVIVGANGDESAYIFKRDGTIWSQQQKLLASDGAFGDSFGCSVSTSGDYAIVGAHGDDDKGDASGSAYIFKRDGTSWNQQAKLTASDGAALDMFSCSVSINSDYAIVGAFGDDNFKGSAYIFRRDGTSWSQQQKLTASDGAAGDVFGLSVSLSSFRTIVGVPADDFRASDSGSAYVFWFCPRADLNDDCKVDFADFAILADWWLYGTD